MLKKVPLDNIFTYAADLDVDIDMMNCSYKSHNNSSKDILTIFQNNIGIQLAMADILLRNSNEANINNIVSFIGLSENISINSQLDYIKKIFRVVHRVYDNQKRVIACEVAEPTDDAVQIFINALKENLLNKWIKVFYSKDIASDCSEIALYKYVCEGKYEQIIATSEDNGFFDYILYGSQNNIVQPGLPISKFKLTEIDKIPYINELWASVDNLYVMVTKTVNTEGIEVYEKFLTWDKIRQ